MRELCDSSPSTGHDAYSSVTFYVWKPAGWCPQMTRTSQVMTSLPGPGLS